MIYSRDTPFWSGTLECITFCQERSINWPHEVRNNSFVHALIIIGNIDLLMYHHHHHHPPSSVPSPPPPPGGWGVGGGTFSEGENVFCLSKTSTPAVILFQDVFIPGHRHVCWLLTSHQHASESQGRIYSNNCASSHTETEVADQTFHLTQSQYADTGPTSPSADSITAGAWQGCRWSANFQVTGMTRPGKKSRRKRDSNSGSSAFEADALTTWPTRRSPAWWIMEDTESRTNNQGICRLSRYRCTKVKM